MKRVEGYDEDFDEEVDENFEEEEEEEEPKKARKHRDDLDIAIGKVLPKIPNGASAYYWVIFRRTTAGKWSSRVSEIPACESRSLRSVIAGADWGGPGTYKLELYTVADDEQYDEAEPIIIVIPEPIVLEEEVRTMQKKVQVQEKGSEKKLDDALDEFIDGQKKISIATQYAKLNKEAFSTGDDGSKFLAAIEELKRQNQELREELIEKRHADEVKKARRSAMDVENSQAGNQSMAIEMFKAITASNSEAMRASQETMKSMFAAFSSQVSAIENKINSNSSGIEKIMENSVVATILGKVVDSILKPKEPKESAIEKILPEMLSAMNATMMGTMGSVIKEVVTFKNTPQVDPIMQKLEFAQKVSGMISPTINDIFDKFVRLQALKPTPTPPPAQPVQQPQAQPVQQPQPAQPRQNLPVRQQPQYYQQPQPNAPAQPMPRSAPAPAQRPEPTPAQVQITKERAVAAFSSALAHMMDEAGNVRKDIDYYIIVAKLRNEYNDVYTFIRGTDLDTLVSVAAAYSSTQEQKGAFAELFKKIKE